MSTFRSTAEGDRRTVVSVDIECKRQGCTGRMEFSGITHAVGKQPHQTRVRRPGGGTLWNSFQDLQSNSSSSMKTCGMVTS